MTQEGFLQQLGNYKLVRVIGQGGFATVYLGRHIHLKNYAAVKVLKVSAQEDLFKKEAQTIMELAHPNIIRVLDFDVQDDIAFIIMDFAPYGSLQAQYRLGTIVPLDAVLSYVKQAASALQYAHDHRIIHRDVKPSNLLVGKQRAIFLSDFGIALLAESSRNTRTTDAAGTVAYIAPEQIRGRPRAASDQYALAVTVYEWLCGTRPFRGTLAEITTQHLSAPPPPLRSHNPAISPHVENIVLQALAKNPLERFPSIEAFADALENAAGVQPRRASQESFTTQNMVNAAPDTVALPAQETRSRGGMTRAHTQLQGQSSRDLASIGTVVGEEPGVGRSRISTDQQRRQSTGISRRTVLLVLGFAGVSGVAGLAFAALHSPSPSQTLIQAHPTNTEQASTPTVASTATSTLQPTPKSTQAPQPTPTQKPAPTPAQPLEPPGTTLATYTGHSDIVFTVAWSPDGTRLASGSQDKTLQIWDAEGANLNTYSGHTGSVTFVSWSPDGKRVASASEDHTIRVWDIATNSLLFTCQGHTDVIHSVAWSPHGTRLASGSVDATVRLWDANNGTLVATYRDHAAQVWDVAWSPDGTRIASASGDNKATVQDNTIKIWNINTNATDLTYTGHASNPVYVSWSPDGTRIASGSTDKTVQVWDSKTGNTQLTYRGHNNIVFGVAWSPDGTRIVSGSVDSTAQVWDARTANTQFAYRGHSSFVFGVAWSPDGTRVASASQDKTVQVWQA